MDVSLVSVMMAATVSALTVHGSIEYAASEMKIQPHIQGNYGAMKDMLCELFKICSIDIWRLPEW